jgi:YidC/Oxa1 family membrane protein insertase
VVTRRALCQQHGQERPEQVAIEKKPMLHDQDNQKNLLLAIVLSVSILLVWQVFYAGPKLKEEQERRQRIQQQQTQTKDQPGAPTAAAPEAAPGAVPQPQPGAAPSAVPTSPTASREAALADSPRVRVDTSSLRGSIALKGGRIDDLVLAKYRETAEPTSPNVVLFSPSGAPEPYYAEYGWVPAGSINQPVPGRDTVWRLEGQGVLTTATPVTLAWDNGKGLVFRRKIAVDADYLFTVTDEVENKTGAAVVLHPYFLLSRHGTPKTQGFYILHEGPIGVLGDAGLQELNYADLLKEGGTRSFKQTGGWLGLTDKYWAAALIPDQKTPYDARFSGAKGPKDTYQADFLLAGISIPAGGRSATTSNLFAGAKQVNLIEGYRDKLGARQFDLLIDWGWFYFITKPLFKLLHWLSQLLGNYGLAILATTVLVKLAFFPLANKSYESMAKMKKLQPEMEKIRDRFKDDRARQQQELMALYKNEKINPMSGCLPILLQIPVFFALYKVLFVTIDMRHAPFFGWIKDLSAPDPTSVFNLFGLLPYSVPDMLHVGAWPLIMGVTMWVQMQLNPQQPDPVQQKIFNWMPVIFTFMLASFPSGLVIYWAWNNVLSLIQQYAIMRRNNTEVHLWKNLGTDKWKARLASAKNVDMSKLKDRMGAASAALPQVLGKVMKPRQKPADGPQTGTTKRDKPMTREQALRTLGLQPDASETEIDAALDKQTRHHQSGLNGSDHVIAAKIDEAREILRGKESS